MVRYRINVLKPIPSKKSRKVDFEKLVKKVERFSKIRKENPRPKELGWEVESGNMASFEEWEQLSERAKTNYLKWLQHSKPNSSLSDAKRLYERSLLHEPVAQVGEKPVSKRKKGRR